MNDDQYLLASAYADGEVTPAERAAAERDPEVMAEVGRLAALRQVLVDTPPPAAERRAAAIAVAMAQFGAEPAEQPAPITPARPPIRPPIRPTIRPARRFTWERAVSLAAAAVAVFVVGAVVITATRGGGGNDDAAEPSSAPAIEAPAGTATFSIEARTAPGDLDAAETMAATDAVTAATTMPADAAELADDDTTATATTTAGATAGATAAGTGESSIPPAVQDPATETAGTLQIPEPIRSPEHLTEITSQLLASQARLGDPASQPDTGCTFRAAVEAPGATPDADELQARLDELAERVAIAAQGEYELAPDDLRPVLLAVDAQTGQGFAIDRASCVLLVVGSAP